MISMPEQTVICNPNPNAGLGNRIICLISSMAIAHKLEANVVINWIPSSKFRADFTDLFKNNEWETLNLSSEELKAYSDQHPNVEVVNTAKLVTSLEELRKTPKHWRFKKGNEFDPYTDTQPEIKNFLLPFFRQLKPVDLVLDEIRSYQHNLNDDAISMTLRTWRDAKFLQSRFNINRVYDILESNPDSQFFLCSDSDEVINHLIEKFGSRLLTAPKRTHHGDRNSAIGIQDALIDVLLVSKTNYMKVSDKSTFSEMGWWFGNCTAQVEVI